MELLESSLFDLLHRNHQAALDDPSRLRVMHETAMGLEYLHASHFMHRDIKTANVMLDHLHRAKVCSAAPAPPPLPS